MKPLNIKLEDLQDQIQSVQDLDNDSFKTPMYAFYDNEAQLFDTPFFCQSDMFAGRHYKMATQKEGMLKQFREKFDVYRLGYFDTKTGEFTEKFQEIINGKQALKLEESTK